MSEFLVLVDGQEATAVYDSSSPVSYVTPKYLESLGSNRYRQLKCLVTVDTSSGFFTCPVELFSHLDSENVNVLLGRDWFIYCTSAFQGADVLMTDGRRLVFNGSPFHAIFAHLSAGK
jgi:hypothetical protein